MKNRKDNEYKYPKSGTMWSRQKKITGAAVLALLISMPLAGCGASASASTSGTTSGTTTYTSSSADDTSVSAADSTTTSTSSADTTTSTSSSTDSTSTDSTTATSSTSSDSTSSDDTSSLFSDRDLEQEADLTDAQTITLQDGEDVTISSAGVYVVSGSATNCTIRVEAGDEDKVQIVLDGVSITNDSAPAIYVVSADKVFVTTTDSENTLSVTGTFTADGDTNTDAVIFSKDDLTLNGTGTLTIESTGNGITSKDDLVITGGTYNITSTEDAIEANDSIAICDGTFNITTDKDGLHCENEDDNTLGSIYFSGGSFTIDAGDDGIQATTTLDIDGGTFDISAVEGLEATYITINDGTITISASDDGINATQKSTSYDVVVEINGGDISITMGSGDTDAVDANGSIYVNGGTIDITANSAFDYDSEGQLNGGTVTVNGSEVTELTGGMTGGMAGGNMNGGGFSGGQGGRMMG
ncbi:MAG: carbohydrate-binding domain-containing protein [Eubacteriales bacterium]|jgi:hypothetical protein